LSTRFDDFSLRPEILRALAEAGYDAPTPIQREAIPVLLGGRDLIGVAETGTGKTLAFVIPIVQRLQPGGQDPQALVVCPTRELALQVAAEAVRFGQHAGLRTVVAYGGTSSADQKRALAAGCDLVVGTPGRLLDFLTSAWLTLRRVRTLVLDEADRMLDMGFINDVDAILRRAPLSRQTLLFSATFPDELRSLSERYMYEPHVVRTHSGTRVTSTVEHAFYPVRRDQKDDLLLELLDRERSGKVLVFLATREATTEVARALRRKRHDVVSLSSLLSQANRERALAAFRSGECNVLVATDVAARGLDILDIDLVINFDVPMQAEDYVHRIGRTGRALRAGRAITFVTAADERRAREIEALLRQTVPRLQLEGFPYRAAEPEVRGRGGVRRRSPRGGAQSARGRAPAGRSGARR